MGIIKAGMGAIGGVLADQWKDYFYCDSLDANTLIARGYRQRSTQGRSSNTTSEDNIISSGSGIAVNEGQCALIVEDGKVVDLVAEAGRFTYDASTEPSIFNGNGLGDLGKNVVAVFKQMGKRFTYGGDPGKNQRIYYVNTKEIIGNKYGTPNGIMFRVYDPRANIDMDIKIKCFGEYSYRITNPILFYSKIGSNVGDTYTRDKLDSQLKAELLGSLQFALAKIGDKGVRYSSLPGYALQIGDELNELLSPKWRDLRGIEVASFGLSSVTPDEEDAKDIKRLQRAVSLGADPRNLAGYQIGGTVEAMNGAANNTNGAMMGFAGMGMAMSAGGMGMGTAAQLYNMGQPQPPMGGGYGAPPPQPPQPGMGMVGGAAAGAAMGAAAGAWSCACGQTGNTGNFCMKCGQKKPAPQAAGGWTCTCGSVNQGMFCPQCGQKKPADAPLYKCDKCGWQPPDPKNPPKFCPQCGDKFDENDKI